MSIVANLEYLKEDGWKYVSRNGRRELWKKENKYVYVDEKTGEFSQIFSHNPDQTIESETK